MRGVLVRTGKFRPETLLEAEPKPGRGPRLDRRSAGMERVKDRPRPDRDRARRQATRALLGVPRALLHRGGAGVLRPRPNPAQHYAALRRQGGGRQGAGVRRPSPGGDRDRGSAEAGRRLSGWTRQGRARGSGRNRPLDDPLAGAGRRDLRRRRCRAEPLYTAAEMQAAEEGHDGDPRADGAWAGRQVAEEVLRRCGALLGLVRHRRERRRRLVVAPARRRKDVEIVSSAPRRRAETRSRLARDELGIARRGVVDALGTGFTRAATDASAASRRSTRRSSRRRRRRAIGRGRLTGEVLGVAVRATLTVTFHAPEGGARGRARALPRRRGRGRGHRPRALARPGTARRHRGCARVGAERGKDDNKYTAGSVLVVGPDRLHRRAVADRRGRDAGGRRDRHRLRPRAAEPRLRAPARRGDEPALPLGRGGPHDRRSRGHDPRGGAEAKTVRSGRGSAGGRNAELVRILLDRLELPVVLDADGLWALPGTTTGSSPATRRPC